MVTTDKFVLTLFISLAVGLLAYLTAQAFVSRQSPSDDNLAGKMIHLNAAFPRIADRICYGLILFFGAVLFFHALFRYSAFQTGNADVALFNQAIWNSSQGRPFQATVSPNRTSVFGTHFNPLLAMLVPLYTITSDLRVLAFVQALVMSAVALPLYWYARAQIGHLLGLVLVIAYFLSPVLPAVNAYGFHDLLLAIVPVALSTYLLLRKKYSAFVGISLIALLAREDVAFVVISFGIYLVIVQRKAALGLAVIGFAFAWVAVATQFVIPRFNQVEMWIGRTYAAFGTNFIEIVINVLTHPLYVFQYIFTPEKITFILHFLVPLALVPLAGFEVTGLAVLPILTLLLSTRPTMQGFFNYYPSPILSLVFFGGIVGLRRILQSRLMLWLARDDAENAVIRAKAALAALIFSSSAITFGLYTLPILSDGFNFGSLTDYHSSVGFKLTENIPDQAVVAAQDDLVARVSNRQRVYVFPSFPDYRQMDYLVADTERRWYSFHKESWDHYLGTGYFEIETQQDGFIIARRRSVDHPIGFRYGDQLTLLGYSLMPTGTLRGGMNLRPIVSWRAETDIRDRYSVTVRVIDRLGHIWAREDREPVDGLSPTSQWKAGETVGDQYILKLPPTIPDGDYAITIGVHKTGEDDFQGAYDEQGKLLGDSPQISPLRIEKNKSSITASELNIEQPLFVDMREMRFIGYYLPSRDIHAGEAFHLGVYWRARAKPIGDYTVAVQLRDLGGRVIAEHSSRPANGTYPTTAWDAGEVLLDWHDFALSPDIALGEYQLFVLLRDQASEILGEVSLSAINVLR